MESQYLAPTDQSTGAVNRQIRVTVRTIGDHHADFNGVGGNGSNSYQDAISIINLNRWCRRYGIAVPRTYWTRLWFVRDCAGGAGAGVTWFLMIAGEVLVFLTLASRHFSFFTLLHAILSFGCASLGAISHLRAMFTDPGAVPRGDATKENIARLGLEDGAVIYRCSKCDCIKPERAHHCSICKRCIRKMDHHCPWINNCVGENNQKFFVLFTMYISIISWHALFLALYFLVSCAMESFEECNFSPPFQIVIFSLLMLEGLMFGLFTAIMCGSQLAAICYDETGIEQLKKETGKWKKRTCWMNIQEVFGGKFSYVWFSPFHSTSAIVEDSGPTDVCVYSTL